MLSGFTVYWGLALAIAFLPLYLAAVGFGGGIIGLVVTVPAFVSIAFMLLGGGLSQRLLRHGVSRHLEGAAEPPPAAWRPRRPDIAGLLMVVGGLVTMLVVRPDRDAERHGLRPPSPVAVATT